MLTVFIILLILLLLFLLSIRGRRGHPGLKALRGWSYAHRGLHDDMRPENSMAAFQAALDAGYGIELDVHLLADGNLAVIHDSLLKRTTGQEGRVEDLTTEQLSHYHLEGTDQTIPTLSQVLALYDGKAPLIIELKSAGNNYNRLTETACSQLKDYTGVYCMESFDPRCVYWLKKHRPDIVRGQLAENFLQADSAHPWLLRFFMTHHLLNFLIRPDFIAYKFADRNRLPTRLVRKLWGIQGVSWTLTSPQQYAEATQEGWIPIFENFHPV